MKNLIIMLLLLVIFSGAFAQNTLVVEKIGTSTRYAFHLGDDVKIRTIKQNVIHKNYLWNLTDSTMTIGQRTVVPLSDVGAVYKNYHFPKFMSKALFIAGAGYLIIDSFNNLINNRQVFVPETLLISGSLMTASLLLVPFWQKKCRIGVKWKVKIMDIYLPD